MADVLFVEHPKCSTCQKAKAWLDEHGIAYDDRDIVTDNPTANELRTWHKRSGLPLRRFFNTSGMLYREMELSKRLPEMSDDEQHALLATNGMLVKRPLLVTATTVIPGFRAPIWAEALGVAE
ncbi:arsenate reductase family protein [Adlercreutzia sp. R25]|nr:arsenate reductase family protein [Adlercreutzia sp. R25]MEC4272212.1 arsenate reductase family protein [Adlercreutzia sp. R25]